MFKSPNAGQTALTLQHATSPRSGYKPPAGHNADGYTMAERVSMAKGMGARFEAKKGGKATHKTKDGRTVKKGLYYYMNRAKKRGTSRPGKGTVTDKALKRSAKTAKKK